MEKISGNLRGVTIIDLEIWLNLQASSFNALSASISKRKSQTPARIFAELVRDRKLNKVFKKPGKVVACRVYDGWITGFRS